MNELLSISPEVADALSAGKAVVALESTIITHGMPYPQNLDMARRVMKHLPERCLTPAFGEYGKIRNGDEGKRVLG